MRRVRILAVFIGLLFTVSPLLAAVCGISCDAQEHAASACPAHQTAHEIASRSSGAPLDRHARHAQCGKQISPRVDPSRVDPSYAAHAATVASMCAETQCSHAALLDREVAVRPRVAVATAALTASLSSDLLPRNELLATQVSWRQLPASAYSPLRRTLRI
jgi:hypothetical protein